mmetsp:Transcript_11433/g.15740  ORF Transcript_11433/g.15740 Transcript_11433/m.15740 type:complete len:896 (+) Transcript_11433:59-2746(+)
MDRQVLPNDWSACNEAINSDFSNANMFWFSHDGMLTDVQNENYDCSYDKLNEMDPLTNGSMSDFISDCNVFPSPLINNGTISQSSSSNIYGVQSMLSNDKNEMLDNALLPSRISIATSNNTQNSTNTNKNVHKKKASPSQNPGKQSMKGKLAPKFPLSAKSMMSKTSGGHHDDESEDENSSGNSDDCKDDSLHIMKSRSSSFDEDENDMSKRKFSSKKGDIQNAREKNREHAKNTRMRKKNYIESLKESIKMLTDERDKNDQERKNTLSKLADQTLLRKKVLQTMFYFRSTAETDPVKWASILEESFVLIMPITPYRSFPPSEVIEGQRHIKGISGVILDTASFILMIQSIATTHDDDETISVQYYSGPNESVMADNVFMCKWHMTTMNAVRKGSRYEITKNGMAKAIFSPQNKLISVELAFDVMSFMQQLRRSSGKFDFLVIPNTPSLAMEESYEARMITEAVKPHRITHVNQSFVELFGYIPEQVIGYTCSILQGSETELDRLNSLMNNVDKNLPCSTTVTNYTADKQKFKNWIRIYPLYSEGKVTHFLGVLERIADNQMMHQKLPSIVGATAAVAVTEGEADGVQGHSSASKVHIHNPGFASSVDATGLGVLNSGVDFGIKLTEAQLQHAGMPPHYSQQFPMLQMQPNSNTALSSTLSVSTRGSSARTHKDGDSISSASGRTNMSNSSRGSSRNNKTTPRSSSNGKQSSSVMHSSIVSGTSSSIAPFKDIIEQSFSVAGLTDHNNIVNKNAIRTAGQLYTNQSQQKMYSYPLTHSQFNDPTNSSNKSNSNNSDRSVSGSGGTSRDSISNFDNLIRSVSEGVGGTSGQMKIMDDGQYRGGTLRTDTSDGQLIHLVSHGSMETIGSDLKFGTNDMGDDGFADITFDDDLLSYAE